MEPKNQNLTNDEMAVVRWTPPDDPGAPSGGPRGEIAELVDQLKKHAAEELASGLKKAISVMDSIKRKPPHNAEAEAALTPDWLRRWDPPEGHGKGLFNYAALHDPPGDGKITVSWKVCFHNGLIGERMVMHFTPGNGGKV